MTTIDGDRLSLFLTIPEAEGDPLAWVTEFAILAALDFRNQVLLVRPLSSMAVPSHAAFHGPLGRIIGSLQDLKTAINQNRGSTPHRPLFTTDWQIRSAALEAYLAEAWRILPAGSYPDAAQSFLLSAMYYAGRLTMDVGSGPDLRERLRLHMPVLRIKVDGFVSLEFGNDHDNHPMWYTKIRQRIGNIENGAMSRSVLASTLLECMGLLEKYQRRREGPKHPDSLAVLIQRFATLLEAIESGGVPGHRLLDLADRMSHPGYWRSNQNAQTKEGT